MSRFLNLADKKTANLFADGAGAAVLGWEMNLASWQAICSQRVNSTTHWGFTAVVHTVQPPQKTVRNLARQSSNLSGNFPRLLTPSFGLN